MSVGDVASLLRGGAFRVLIVAAPVLLAALVVGLVAAIAQALTSVQDQSLSFVPKLAAVLLILALLGGWMFGSLAEYTRQIFALIPAMAR